MNKNRVSYQQLMIMGDFFLKHPQLAKGFSQNKEGRNHSRQLWEQLTLLLNSEALGASKSAQNWTAYWNDYKSKLKKKNRLYNNDAHGTGSGPPDKDKEPGEADAKFLAVLGVDFGTGIPGASVNPFPQDDSESVREEINEICGPTMDYNQTHDHQYLKANTTASFTEASTSTSVLECEGEDVHLHDEDHQTDYPIVIEMEEDPLSNQQPRRRSRPMTKFDEAQEVLSTIERDRVAAELTHAQALLAIREELGTLVLCYKKFMDRVADRDTRDHALNERRVGAEEQRVDAEERRAVAEERRVDAEERRAAAEERRAAAEERRADADERRAAAEERRAHAAELRTSNCGCCKNNTNNV